jgi:beta-RFAP synthase
MIRVLTGSRLHFGLLRPPPAEDQRGFGGCGLMIEAPAVRVAVEPASDWSATGPSADRALDVGRHVAQDRPHRIVVEECPPEHVGLGVGTQLSLAVARAVTQALGGPVKSAVELARLTGRGGRSGVGVHGFDHGGFLVDGGKRGKDMLAPLVARAEFPPEWRIVLLTPPGPAVWHGDRERAAFAALAGTAADDSLCRLVLLGMLPALAEHDLQAFSAALYEYNTRAGEPFRAAQGGSFAAGSADLIDWVRRQGIAGVGQSSWGPTVFGVVGDAERGAATLRQIKDAWPNIEGRMTPARNHGAH